MQIKKNAIEEKIPEGMAYTKVNVVLVNFYFSFIYVHIFVCCMVNVSVYAYIFVREYRRL